MNFEIIDINLEISKADLKVAVPVFLALVSFIIFWFTYKSEKIKNAYVQKYGEEKASEKFIIFTKWLGGIVMGVLPLIGCLIVIPEWGLAEYGLTFRSDTLLAQLVWTLGISALVIPLASISARKPKNLVNYPQIRMKEWDRSLIIRNALAWAVYLLGYEFLFRGVLLFPLVDSIGLWPAIAVNIALYSGTHIPKGLDETIGAIPLSIVLCILTMQTGTIWIAFFVHLAMAWTNSFTALKHHPEMKVIKR